MPHADPEKKREYFKKYDAARDKKKVAKLARKNYRKRVAGMDRNELRKLWRDRKKKDNEIYGELRKKHRNDYVSSALDAIRKMRRLAYLRLLKRKPSANRDRYIRDKDRINSRCRAVYAADPKRYDKKRREYRNAHLAEYVARTIARDLHKKMVTVGDRKEIVSFYVTAYSTKGIRCSYCNRVMEVGGKHRNVDHVIPLARKGIHAVSNLAVSCVKCNSSKGAMTGDEFRASKKLAAIIASLMPPPTP